MRSGEGSEGGGGSEEKRTAVREQLKEDGGWVVARSNAEFKKIVLLVWEEQSGSGRGGAYISTGRGGAYSGRGEGGADSGRCRGAGGAYRGALCGHQQHRQLDVGPVQQHRRRP